MKLTLKSFLLASLCWVGCMRPGPNPAPAPRTSITLYYRSQNGDDLLNPATAGNYSKGGIQVTDIVTKNGVATEVATNVENCGTNVCQSPQSNIYHIYFHPDKNYEGTLIHHGSVIDTLVYTKVPMNSTYVVSKVLYKGQILWSQPTAKPTEYLVSVTIVK